MFQRREIRMNGYGALKLSLFRNPLTGAPVIGAGRK